jgi:hypothetical protein
MMDLHSNKFVLASKMEEYYGGIKSKGGVLADAVGLGKTLECKIHLAYVTQSLTCCSDWPVVANTRKGS